MASKIIFFYLRGSSHENVQLLQDDEVDKNLT